MENAEPADTHALKRRIREIHGVFDIAVDEIIIQLVRCHNGGFLFAFRRAGAQMRHADHVLHADQALVREVRDIFSDLAGGQRIEHRVIIDDFGAGFIDDAHALFHFRERGLSDHLSVGIGKRNVNADIIGFVIDLIDIHRMLYAAGKTPRRVNGKIRIIADHVHAELDCDIRNQRADCTESDDTKGLSGKLGSCKRSLPLLDQLGNLVSLRLQALDPLDAAQNVSGRHHERAQNQLLHGFGIRAGRVKDDDTLIAALVERDIVGSRAGPPDRDQGLSKMIIVQIRAAQQDRVRIGDVLPDLTAALTKKINAALGDMIHCLDAEMFNHGVQPQIVSYIAKAHPRPPWAWHYRSMRAFRL